MKKKTNGNINKLLQKSEKIYFIRRLYELVSHGYMLEDSIEFLMIQYNASDEIILNLKEEMSNGKKLSYILEKLNYDSTVVSKMKFAEHYGKVESMLLEIEKYLILKKEQREKIIKTIRYPLILTTMLILLLLIFNLLVIPQFSNIYSSSNIQMDNEIIILINILYYLPKFLIFILVFLVTSFGYIYFTYRYRKNLFLNTILKIPILKDYYILYFSYQYSAELSLFLMSGFSIKTTLEEIIDKDYNYYFTYFSNKINDNLNIGISFEDSVNTIPYLNDDMYKFIVHGRKNSMLDKELKLFSDIMLDRFIILIDKRLKKIQPILFGLLAVIVVGLYLVILLPIFNMTSSLK